MYNNREPVEKIMEHSIEWHAVVKNCTIKYLLEDIEKYS